MSTRAARFGDYWRTTFARNYSCQYTSLDYVDVRVLYDSTISFSKGITAVVGGNGVGKTTLAQAIVEALAGEEGVAALRNSSHRLFGCSLNATVVGRTGATQTRTLTVDATGRTAEGDHEISYQWLDPSTMAMLCQKQVLGDTTFRDEVLESLTPRILTDEQLSAASYLVGKDYSSCTVWEVRDYGPYEAWPYFEVACSGILYGSENMGQGELALLTALWAIEGAPNDSIIVLEEPETHVSAKSQSALMDTLAWACAKKGLWVVVTTHSPVVLQKLPQDHIRLLVSEAGRSRLIPAPRLHDVATVVGGGAAYKCLLLVEDHCAKYFVQALLEQVDPDMGRQCAFAIMDGEAKISLVLNNLPAVGRWTRIIGCFDGDMRGKIDVSKFSWPHIFLPGPVAPEPLLRSCAAIHVPAALSGELHVDEASVSVALSAVAGIDSHDWLTNLAQVLERSREESVRAMVRVWLRGEATAGASFLADLKTAFDG